MIMRPEKRFFVYILASKPWGTLYVGMSGNLQDRVHQHRLGLVDGFSKKYNVKILVYFEEHPTALDAINREKTNKEMAPCVEDQSHPNRQSGLDRPRRRLVSENAHCRRGRKLGRPDRARRRDRTITRE